MASPTGEIFPAEFWPAGFSVFFQSRLEEKLDGESGPNRYQGPGSIYL